MLSNLNNYYENNVNKSDLFLFNTFSIKNIKYGRCLLLSRIELSMKEYIRKFAISN